MPVASTPQTDILIETHRPYARALAAQILRVLPPHVDRTEIAAAADLGLVEAASSFDSRRDVQFKTFAYYHIRGAVYDRLRILHTPHATDVETPPPAASAEQQLQSQQQRRSLTAALAALPSSHRQVVEAYYFLDLSLQEIGNRLNLSRSWVCRIHSRSLGLLRRGLHRGTISWDHFGGADNHSENGSANRK